MDLDFTYTPSVVETEITTTETTTNYMGNVTVVETKTTQVDVVPNFGDIARFGFYLLLGYSICWVASKLVTAWRKGV
jgi:hypothetical protein